jgi:hypothetical protein
MYCIDDAGEISFRTDKFDISHDAFMDLIANATNAAVAAVPEEVRKYMINDRWIDIEDKIEEALLEFYNVGAQS